MKRRRWLSAVVLALVLSTVWTKSAHKRRHGKQARRLLEQLAAVQVGGSAGSIEDGALYPPVFDAASGAVITASATCGEDGPEKYCRELASTRIRGLGAGACGTCDSHSVAQRHPASHAIDDDTTTWWQSPSLAQGEEYESVDLVLDLGDVFELVYLVAASGPSARAAAFSLSAREDDEHEWQALHHFARDQRLCASLFQNATCETYFTARKPLENGEIHISLEGEAAVRARWVRVSLRALHDAHAPDRRYYSVRALSVGARCACNGHANTCTIKDGKSVCACREGACGVHCERCCEGWRAAPWTAGRACEACPCGARARDCTQDSVHGVICVDCLGNTAGPRCEHCEDGYYKKGVGVDDQFGICLSCDCHPIGSKGTCRSGVDGEPACACRDGFAGARCEHCAGEQGSFPSCAPTKPCAACDERGVIEHDMECGEQCTCKLQVRGALCDSCAPGHFALSTRHDEGCLPCYCSGEADECQAYDPTPTQIQTQEGWTVSDIGVTYTEVPMYDSEKGWLSFGYLDLPNFEHFFWNAPAAYLGNKLEAYGGRLDFRVSWDVMRGDSSGKSIAAPQMIIIGTNGLKIAFGESEFKRSDTGLEISTMFREAGWYHVPASVKDIVTRRRRTFLEFQGEPVTRFQFMSVLSDIKYILLRAKFNTDQVEVRLLNAIIHVGGDNGTEHYAVVERCSCPVGYAGLSCERCAFGFARVAAQDGAGWACVACDCHGHAESCDVESGRCSSCLHNTDGERCERCLPGYYGDARSGGCRQCACPLLDLENNFSPACVTDPDVPDRYVCTECPKGYAGDHCEVCDYGFWGAPGVRGGACVACESCGNAPCDMNTGDCLECPDNTEGYKCQGCKELYWRGSARACMPCSCSATGAASQTCELHEGACTCRPRYTGRTCDICEEGFGNVTAGCPACTCNVQGAASACDARTGACTCKSGVGGALCDTCLDLHFGFGDDGCSGCTCSVLGAEGASCDIRTGQCRCRQHVTGLSCDKCEPGYWGLSRTGCTACSCDAQGSMGTCDSRSGVCTCKPGVGGMSCNTCLPGYYGYGANGCLQCPTCALGQVCDARTGRCACPPLSVGPSCRECRAASWGNEPGVGCKPCSCSPVGSEGTSCDVRTGACECRAGWAGARCDVCARGYFGARCRPCACEAAGTRNSTCDADSGICDCDQATGQCACKENVEGPKCTTCRDGSFGLSARNSLGCTRCFCFGRSSRCTQAGLTWGRVRAQTRHLHVQATTKPSTPLSHSQFRPPINFISINKEGELPLDVYAEDENVELTATNGITVIPETDGNITIGINQNLPYPLYWELPEKFRHDQVTSYGGFLHFECHSTGLHDEIPEKILGQYPLVQIHSHGVLILEYYEFYPNTDGIYEVRFHESLWSLQSPSQHGVGTGASNGLPVERSTLMVALQHIDHIYIRATKHSAPIQATLVSVSMDTAILVSGQPSGAPVASGVEMCSCPEAYDASSCQEAAIGFWIPPGRRPDAEVAANADGTIIIQLISQAEPCYCNGRSNVCDKHTGYCLNCTENSSGAECEVCAPGYYGSPQSGCRACPCPSPANNRAAACQVLPDTLTCNCTPGYTGEDCSLCAVGWYRAQDGSCVACGCAVGGARGMACSAGGGAGGGQCACRDHTTGRRCHLCKAPRHFLEGDLCVPCDNCTQTLLDTVESLTYALMREADPRDISAIPKPYPRLQIFANQTEELQKQVYSVIQAIYSIQSLPRDPYAELESRVEIILQRAKNTSTGQDTREKTSWDLKKEAEHLLKRIFLIENEVQERIKSLEEFTQSERHVSIHRALKEGRNLLRKIKAIDLVDPIASAHNVQDKARLQAKFIQNYEKQLNYHKGRISSLQEGFSTFNKKIADLTLHKDRSWNNMEQVMASTKTFKNHLKNINDKIENIRTMQDNVIELKRSNSTQKSAVIVEQCVMNFEMLPATSAELMNLTNLAEEKEGILYRIVPDYRDEYLGKATAHADNLTMLANEYKSLFSETRSGAGSAVAASTAYADIAARVANARAAAAQALQAAERAASGPHARALRERDVEAASEGLLRKAEARVETVKEMLSELEKSRQKVDRIRLAIRGIGWIDKDLTVRTGSLGNVNVSGHLAIANNKSDRVYENMRALYKEADAIHKDTLYKLKRKLQDLQSHGDDKIGGAEEKVSLARGNIKKGSEIARSLLGAAQMRGQEAAHANHTLAAALRQLYDKIARAKHAAQGIQVSLRSKPSWSAGCMRSYRIPHLAPSSTSRVVLALSLGPQDMRDSVLFHLAGASSGDFLTIEIVSRRVKFSWNLGGDTASAVYPDMLDPVGDSDYAWYRIQAERIWNTGRVDVRRISSSGVASKRSPPATNSSSAQWGVLHVGGADVARVGGEGGGGLAGCLHKLTVDGHRVGLWNFHSEVTDSQCIGCTEGTEEASSSDEINMYHFNGQGYSVLHRADSRPHNRHQLSVALTFRTHDEDALLFMAVDSANNRSVSLSLRACRVVFRVEYADGAALEMSAAGRHCSGRLVRVQAARVFVKRKLEKGSLRVNGEETLGSPNPPIVSSAALPDLSSSVYWVGGVPPAASLWESPPPPLLGCLGDITVDQEGYNPMDTTQHYGVEPKCSDRPLSLCGFRGDGYLELASHSLPRKTQWGLMFRSARPDAMLVFSVPRRYRPDTDTDLDLANQLSPDYGAFTTETELPRDSRNNNDGDGFYSIALSKGDIVVILNAGKGNLKLASNNSKLNDGRFHSVRLVKSGRKIELSVDDKPVSLGSLLGGSVLPAGERAGLFVGGLPAHLDRSEVTDQRVATTKPLQGAVKDIIFDGSSVGLGELVSMRGALVGRAGPGALDEEAPDANEEPRAEEPQAPHTPSAPQGCQKVASYTLEPGAVKFGDVPQSYAQVHVSGRSIWQRDLLLAFHFRTFYPNGLLFIAPGSKEKHRHLLAVYLRDGRLTLMLKARRKKEIFLPQIVNDGQWRHVILRCTGKRLSLVLGARAVATRLPKKLLLSNVMYVGGLPERASMPNIPEHIWKLEGLKGCMRKLTVNGRPEDLVRDAALHHNVGQCFPDVEKGAHFAGDAHAVWSHAFALGAHLELRMEFRTAESNGVLLATARAPHMSLELHDGNLVMTVKWGRGSRLRVSAAPSAAFGLCDNAWHSLSALYSADGLSLRLDRQPERVVTLAGGTSATSATSAASADDVISINEHPPQSPLYIGGIPDGAGSGTLLSRENFKGCIRNVAIRGHRKDWTDMDAIHNVLLSSCPVVQS